MPLPSKRDARAAHKAALNRWRRGEGPRPPVLRPSDWRRRGSRAQDTLSGQTPCIEEVRNVLVASDIHWNSDGPSWRAIRRFHAYLRPAHTILLGDMFDAACAAHHPPSKDDPQTLVEEIDRMVIEANALRSECDRLTLCVGNHDRRVEAYLRGPKPWITRGLKGLTLPEIARAHGLRADINWFEETAAAPSLTVGQFELTHGHNGASRFGAGVHAAANAIARSNGVSTLRGHIHRAQMFCRTAYGRLAIGLQNPCAARRMDYAPNGDWQFGCTVLSLCPPDYGWATPHVLVCDDRGGFAWHDRYFSGDP